MWLKSNRIETMAHHVQSDTIVGTVGGTILALVPQLDSGDVVRTFIMATAGAAASFLTTKFLKWIWSKIRRRIGERE